MPSLQAELSWVTAGTVPSTVAGASHAAADATGTPRKGVSLPGRICAHSLLLPNPMPKAFFYFAPTLWPCWGKDGSSDSATRGQPNTQGEAMQLPNPVEHSHKAAPLRHPLAQQPAAHTDQALSWLGLEGVPWASWAGTTAMPAAETSVPTHAGATPGSTTTTTRFPVADGGSTWGCGNRCPSKQESTVQ